MTSRTFDMHLTGNQKRLVRETVIIISVLSILHMITVMMYL